MTNFGIVSKKDGPASLNPNDFSINNTNYQEGQSSMPSKKGNFAQREAENNILITGVTQRSKANRIRRGMMAGPLPQVFNLWETCTFYVPDIFFCTLILFLF